MAEKHIAENRLKESHIVAVAALCLAACGQSSTPVDDSQAKSVVREDKPGLTQAYAEFRAQQVENVRYRLTSNSIQRLIISRVKTGSISIGLNCCPT